MVSVSFIFRLLRYDVQSTNVKEMNTVNIFFMMILMVLSSGRWHGLVSFFRLVHSTRLLFTFTALEEIEQSRHRREGGDYRPGIGNRMHMKKFFM